MSEKISQFVIDLGGSDTELRALFSGVKQRLRSDVAELEAIGKKLDLFGGISDSLPQVQRALDSAKSKVTQFAAEIQKIESAGGKAPKALTDALKDAEKATAAATRELARQQQQLTTLGNQLTRAGVDTKNLAAEQARLAEASRIAGVAAEQTAAKQLLGLRTLKDVTPEIAKQRAAFDLLKNSGTLSATEIAAAQKLLDGRIRELTTSVTTAGGSFTGMGAAVTPMLLRVASAAAVIGTVGAAFNSVTEAAKAYNNSLAQVGTVTTLSKGELDALGGRARALATELGINLPDALKSLYEIIRSGVPADNAIEVLRVGALAAKAAFVETGVGAKAAALLVDAFGLEVSQLSGALDIVTRSAQTGGPTLTEFAETAGKLGNVARATGVGFQEVVAVLNVMTDASNDAAGSASALTKILVAMNRPEVRLALQQLGLDGKSFVETLRAINRDVPGGINAFLDLGIANTKAAAAIAAVVNNTEKLPKALNDAATAAGTMATAVAKIYDTPEERKKRFDAALEETKIQIGQTVDSTAGLLVVLANVLKAYNVGAQAIKEHDAAVDQQNKKLVAAALKFFGYKSGIETATVAQTAFVQASVPLADSLEKIDAKLAKATEKLPLYSKALADNTALLQKAITDQVATLTERANQEIALLDKSAKAQVASAAEAVKIQTKLNADILKLLQEHEVAVQVIVLAREDALKKSGAKQVEIEKEIAKLRNDALAPVLEGYKKHYAALIQQAAGYKSTLDKIETERASFAEAGEARVRAARIGGLTDLQKYAEKSAEFDRLIAKGRTTAATEGFEAAKKYFQQADTISETIKGEVISDGLVVITQFQSEQKALDLSKRAAQAYNDALGDAKGKAETGAEATKKAMADTAAVIEGIQKQLDAVKDTLSKGIKISINKKIEGIDEVRAEIDKLVATRTLRINVQTAESAPDFVGPPQQFKTGGPVWKRYATQQFANGGPVFNRPSWSKVPGVGNGDTVPALLKEGSFVVKKSATKMYGDSVMGRLARGYAAGGTVSGSDDWRAVIAYAKSIMPFLRHPIWRGMVDTMFADMRSLERNPKDAGALRQLLGIANEAAANLPRQDWWGHSFAPGTGSRTLPSFEEFLERYNAASTRKFAVGGGVGTDTVPAMLTPGEWVIPAPVARKWGGGFLNALNNMKIPMPQIPRFATGGPVGSVPDRGSAPAGMGGITINISATGADFSDPSAVRRLLLPAMRDIQRRTGS